MASGPGSNSNTVVPPGHAPRLHAACLFAQTGRGAPAGAFRPAGCRRSESVWTQGNLADRAGFELRDNGRHDLWASSKRGRSVKPSKLSANLSPAEPEIALDLPARRRSRPEQVPCAPARRAARRPPGGTEVLNAPQRPRSAPSTTTRERSPPPAKIQWSWPRAWPPARTHFLHALGVGPGGGRWPAGRARSATRRSAPWPG